MAYDEVLTGRIRDVVHGEKGVTEKKMFGANAFLVNGNLAVGASGRGLLLRVDPAEIDALTSPSHVGRFEMRGREMTGWLRVDAAALESDADLRRWVGKGLAYAGSLPAK